MASIVKKSCLTTRSGLKMCAFLNLRDSGNSHYTTNYWEWEKNET